MSLRRITLNVAFLLSGFTLVFGQASAEVEKAIDYDKWYHYSYENTGVFGVNDTEAHAYLQSKGIKPHNLIVGILDSGVDVEHEDLAANMWVNTDEVAGNNKDDDHNGYVDDVHGWNFIGGANGDVSYDTLEITRLFKIYSEMFEGLTPEKLEEAKEKYPFEFQEYQKIKAELPKKIQTAKQNLEYYQALIEMVTAGSDDLIQQFGDQKLSKELLGKYEPSEGVKPQFLMIFTQIPEEEYTGKTAAEFKDFILEELNGGVEILGQQVNYQYNLEFDPRPTVGDDYDDKTEQIYGNNHYEGPDAKHGTHVAGLVAAVRGNGLGIDGIGGNHIKIMTVRTVPDGDERDKDVANAIRYAVDNGAKILNMSFGKAYSPERELVWEAMQYAADKGVLLVKAAGNDNVNIDEEVHYPTAFNDDGDRVITNIITVGANGYDSDKLKTSFSNYGAEGVDVFAPGFKIYSTIPDNQYEHLPGTSMASPIVAGVAALVWSHFPDLTAEQVREIILKSVNKTARLEGISVTGGVVDALKAVKFAEAMSKS